MNTRKRKNKDFTFQSHKWKIEVWNYVEGERKHLVDFPLLVKRFFIGRRI